MLLWTIVPLELIFSSSEQHLSTSKIINYKGTQLEVELLSEVECKVVRVISTNPADYLNPKLEPGSILYYQQLG